MSFTLEEAIAEQRRRERAAGGGRSYSRDEALAMLRESNRMSGLSAGWRGVQDGLTFGFADEFAGLVGGDEEKERVRAEQARARAERPGWYTAGEVGSALIPIGGPASALLRGARAASNVGRSANVLNGSFDLARSVAGAAGGGAAYGTLNRLGNSEGTSEERLAQLSPDTIATDAAFGVTGLGAMQLLGAGVKGFSRHAQQSAAREAHEATLGRANNAVASAEADASALLPHQSADRARQQAFQRMVDEAITAQGANPQSLQSMAQRFGITLPRSMAGADRDGRTWLWEAYDGVHGPAARAESERLISRLFDETPTAFMRVVDDGPSFAPATAQEGASEFRAQLQGRNAQERQVENAAWDSFNPQAATFKFRAKGDSGLPTLGKQIDAELHQLRVHFDHPNESLRRTYAQLYPRAKLARDHVKGFIENINPRKPGTLQDVVAIRRFVSDAYDAARDDADRAAVYAVQRGLDDWLEQSMPAQIRQSGTEVARQFEAANAATRTNRQLFKDNKHVARMTAEEGDAERAISTLIGTRGVQPQHGAHLTMRMLRERFGAESDAWRTLKLTILRRFSDPLEEALNRDNPRAFNTAYAQLDDFLRKHNEFIVETFTPNERFRLEQLRAVMRQMQTPGPGASNPSRSGVTAARLMQSVVPGAKTAGDIWRDSVMAPRAARQELEATAPPAVWGPTARSALYGAAVGPDSFVLNATAGSANAAFAQEQERQRRATEALLQEVGYGY